MMRESVNNPQFRHHGGHDRSAISRREAKDPQCNQGEVCAGDGGRTKSASTKRPPYLSSTPGVGNKKSTLKPVIPGVNAGPPNIPKVPPYKSNRPSDKVLRELEIKEFYKNYDAMEGALTAIVLGGFFAFVCLLVMYKTKCRPMWKNRRKRLTTTPATASVAEIDGDTGLPGGIPGSLPNPPVIQQEFHEGCQFDPAEDLEEEEEYNFECIPLQSVCNEEENDDDIYFLDEYGNYVFPLQNEGTCSCPPSAEELNNTLRRVSQVSSVSAPYTVKSLPGAFLYIPVVESKPLQSVPSLPSVKRALSDPQIHFAPPLSGHPIILTVNPTSEAASSGVVRRNNSSSRKALALQPRSFSVNVEPSGSPTKLPPPGSEAGTVVVKQPKSLLITESIDINVIQPTPNISPSASLTALDKAAAAASASSAATANAAAAAAAAAAAPPTLPASTESAAANSKPAAELTPVNTPVKKSGGSSVRRVSFSEDEVTSVCSDPAGESPHRTRRSRGGSLATSTRQMTVPMAANAATMSYLQVPGQQLVAPHLSTEAVAAQTSPQARRRRATRLLKTGSFCSITSEGDGDIFGDVPDPVASAEECALLGTAIANNSGRASISTMGSSPGAAVARADPLSDYSELHSDGGCSDISDLFRKNAQELEGMSFDDISCEVPTVQVQRGTNAEGGDGNSLYSLSLGSEDNNPREIITVPVTIEHPPPELREPQTSEASTQQATPAAIAHHRLDSIEASGASLEACEDEASALLPAQSTADEETNSGMRMVLVRDIGIQVCGDSPNLNLARKFKPGSSSGHSHHHHHHHHHHHKSSKQDSLAEKFPAEILF